MLSDSLPFLSIPQEVLLDIAVLVADDHASIIPLLQTCSAVRDRLVGWPHRDTLYARIFRRHFSFTAVQRRAFHPTSSEFAEQARRYCSVLRAIRNGENTESMVTDDDFDLTTMVEIAYHMILDDDGRNIASLNSAGAYEWVKDIVLNGLYDNSVGGYPNDNDLMAFGLEVFWALTTQERLDAETADECDAITRALLPLITLPFKVCTTCISLVSDLAC
jgi:hypothetical protein